MVCMQCGYEPCECQRALVVPTMWVDQTCCTPGCSVVIRSRAGKQASTLPVCKWCQAGQAYYRKTMSPLQQPGGPSMTKEEFGSDLYDAIVLRTAEVMALGSLERLRKAGKVREALEVEKSAHKSNAALQRVLDKGTIDPKNMRRLLSITA